MKKAIQVKTSILGSEISEDIAYLYNELAVTYQGNDDLENAAKCVRKQLGIFDHLKKTDTLEYVSSLTFLGEMYVDMENHVEAIDVLERAIAVHDKISKEAPAMSTSEAAHLSMVPDTLEKVAIMKILAEQYMKNGQFEKGIDIAQAALFVQKSFFHDMINDQVQETILLLAEAFTSTRQNDEALSSYKEVLDARNDNYGGSNYNNKDIYRKMAALHYGNQQYVEAIDCLSKVIEQETQDLVKVGLLTKIGGYYKKTEDKEKCIQATTEAYELMKSISGENDAQSCKCKLNLASVYQHYEMNEEAKKSFQEFLD